MDAVNLQSLNLIREELVSTIEEAAAQFDKFVDTEDISATLNKSVECISQITGTLKLIEFSGAELLTQELLITVKNIPADTNKPEYRRWLEVISSTFIVLNRYIEYVQQTETRLPMLLVPQINELRKLRVKPSIPECYFFEVELSTPPTLPRLPRLEEIELEDSKFNAGIKRIRHMYQIGLIGLIKDRQIENSVTMMRRALVRIHRVSGRERSLSLLWWLSDVALNLLIEQKMHFVETRKLLFGRIERVIRQVEKDGVISLDAEPPNGLIKELVYLIALSGSESEEVQRIRHAYGFGRFTFTDEELVKQRRLLHGPSLSTLSTLVEILRSEIASTKDIVETASLTTPHEIEDIEGFVGILQRLAETLRVVGLNSASETLKAVLKNVHNWLGGDQIKDDELEELVSTLLYLDTVVSSIVGTELSDEKLEAANQVAQSEVIAQGLLADAKRIALVELESSLTHVKTAIDSYIKSDFDVSHSQDIDKTLVAACGALLMLNCNQAATVLLSCAQFVVEVLIEHEPPPNTIELLEVFADAIISVEYYLQSANGSFQMDHTVLLLAEESVEALGYSAISTENQSV